jgi:DNA modification methylase
MDVGSRVEGEVGLVAGAEDHSILCGDCRELAPNLGKFDLIFADPPFGIGQKYNGFTDRFGTGEFADFTRQWVLACWNACDGVMALHGPDDLAELYLQIARDLGMRRIAWVNLHYRFGQCSRRNWIDARCHCLIYSKREKHTWNPEDVLVESDRVGYGDKRVNETERGGKRLPGTIWGIPSDGPHWGRVSGSNAERREKHPNQLCENYLARLIRAYSNPGDRILDPYCGSGTTVTVAKALGRKCVTIDISPDSVESAKQRLIRGAVRV